MKENTGGINMKIKEILTREELEFAKTDDDFLCTDELDCSLMDHMDEMELSDYLSFRKVMELTQISYTLIRIGRILNHEQSHKDI